MQGVHGLSQAMTRRNSNLIMGSGGGVGQHLRGQTLHRHCEKLPPKLTLKHTYTQTRKHTHTHTSAWS